MMLNEGQDFLYGIGSKPILRLPPPMDPGNTRAVTSALPAYGGWGEGGYSILSVAPDVNFTLFMTGMIVLELLIE